MVAIARGGNFSLALVGDGPPVQHAPMVNSAVSTNGFTVSLVTQCGRVYRLEYKDSLEDGGWTALPLVAGNGGMRTLTDSTLTTSPRFYRVRQW